MTWKIGCGVVLLGFVLSLASCGLFGQALNRMQDQRSIATRPLERDDDGWFGAFDVEADASVRIEFTAEVEIGDDDLARADSTSAILQSTLAANFFVEGPQGDELTRGARSMSGTEILSAADHPSRRDTPDRFTVRVQTEPFRTTDDGRHVAVVAIGDRDDQGRRVATARMTVFDRVPTDVGGWAAGGLASFLLGPFVAFVGIVVFAVGLLLRTKAKESA